MDRHRWMREGVDRKRDQINYVPGNKDYATVLACRGKADHVQILLFYGRTFIRHLGVFSAVRF
jgi:hypothetical protein